MRIWVGASGLPAAVGSDAQITGQCDRGPTAPSRPRPPDRGREHPPHPGDGREGSGAADRMTLARSASALVAVTIAAPSNTGSGPLPRLRALFCGHDPANGAQCPQITLGARPVQARRRSPRRGNPRSTGARTGPESPTRAISAQNLAARRPIQRF